ncbi:MAG: hypothetical protein CMP71_02605 [Flavobacteriales bacterium]|nr:hypothetical protein [Flavobacteriales bacterium]
MKLIGFIVFLLIFFMAFWCLIFLASVVPFFILVWLKEGKLDKDQILP